MSRQRELEKGLDPERENERDPRARESERDPQRDASTLSKLATFLTVPELARLLRVNRNTAYEAVQRGDIPGLHAHYDGEALCVRSIGSAEDEIEGEDVELSLGEVLRFSERVVDELPRPTSALS